ncbi:hypothetical protein I3842_15G100300 [Carya illinoinensis]|uniref:Uncharacterized protein n=1 Tax=Carya illinoinensis TaxID=32201 RepID=A0A922A5Y7_CARIL|nr:hypothetical protein I3842_15G100300 [Carya illinoinensis]
MKQPSHRVSSTRTANSQSASSWGRSTANAAEIFAAQPTRHCRNPLLNHRSPFFSSTLSNPHGKLSSSSSRSYCTYTYFSLLHKGIDAALSIFFSETLPHREPHF